MSKFSNFLVKVLIAALSLFAITFTVYFFNVDMKLTSMIEPLLIKHYDSMPRKNYI